MVSINISKNYVDKILKESKKSKKEMDSFLKNLIKEEIKRLDIIDARGTVRIGDYVFEYTVVGRKIKSIKLKS